MKEGQIIVLLISNQPANLHSLKTWQDLEKHPLVKVLINCTFASEGNNYKSTGSLGGFGDLFCGYYNACGFKVRFVVCASHSCLIKHTDLIVVVSILAASINTDC